MSLSIQKILILKKYSLKRLSSKTVVSSDFLLDYDSSNSTGPSSLRFITKKEVDFQIFGLTQIWPWAITNHQRRGKIINLKLDRLLSNTVRFWLLSRIMIRKLNEYYLMYQIFAQNSTNEFFTLLKWSLLNQVFLLFVKKPLG